MYGEGWYFRVRERFISRFLTGVRHGSRVLDVGCGNGMVHRILSGCEVTGVDPLPAFPGAVRGTAEELPFTDESFDVVTCFDVLEHVNDHERAVSEIRRVLRAEGTAYFTVPIYPWLWSGHDEKLGHVRRYRPGELGKLLSMNGFIFIESRFFFSILLPAVVLARKVFKWSGAGSMVKGSSLAERALSMVCDIEVRLGLKWPFGLTEMVKCKKGAGG